VRRALKMGETSNNIMGSTYNPYNRYLSAGGACGGKLFRLPGEVIIESGPLTFVGEGALLALRGSPLGCGSDIGEASSCSIFRQRSVAFLTTKSAGSIRIPSAFNSLFGLRPSHGRLPSSGIGNSVGLQALPILQPQSKY